MIAVKSIAKLLASHMDTCVHEGCAVNRLAPPASSRFQGSQNSVCRCFAGTENGYVAQNNMSILY